MSEGLKYEVFVDIVLFGVNMVVYMYTIFLLILGDYIMGEILLGFRDFMDHF